MTQGADAAWRRFKSLYIHAAALGFGLDVSRMGLTDEYLAGMGPPMADALRAMQELEAGAVSNPDEERRVGHYWLRAPELAPEADVAGAITATRAAVEEFAGAVHEGRIAPPAGGRFTQVLSLGIGGSALGPQLVSRALDQEIPRCTLHFMDNTDPDGFDHTLREIGGELIRTLVLVISKSGATAETRNALHEVERALHGVGESLADHAVAVTGEGSALDVRARNEGWLARFPMWDWIGGRTSETSAVGLLPAALQGIDVGELLRGAAAMDVLTRNPETRSNPAAMLALAWHCAGGGMGKKAMVVLPYKDRLDLLARYLQQLVMESLGKEHDLEGRVVHQGLTVYGNKGSTDQHAFVQQLRDGPDDFFVTFVQVLAERAGEPVEVEPGATSGDYLFGFMHGTRQTLSERGRACLTITLDDVTPASVGALIALFERATGLYATLVGINAYHQPGVEAGKSAAAGVLDLQRRLMDSLGAAAEPLSLEELVARVEADPEQVFHCLRHLAATRPAVRAEGEGVEPWEKRWRLQV